MKQLFLLILILLLQIATRSQTITGTVFSEGSPCIYLTLQE